MHPDAFLVACLERSKSAGLHINITSTFSCSDSFLEIIKAESYRWDTILVGIQGMDYETRAGFLRFCDLCEGLLLPQLKVLVLQGPYRVRGQIFEEVIDDSSMQFYNHWIAPNLTQATFLRIVPSRLSFSPTILNMELPQYKSPHDATFLDLLQSLNSLQDLSVTFQSQYYFRFSSRAPITMENLTALKITAQANEESTLLAPQSLISSLQMPILTHLCIKLRCDRKYALQYYQREDAVLADLIPEPEHHPNLSSLQLDLILSSSGLWAGRTPDLQLSGVLSKVPLLRDLLVSTNFNIAPLLGNDGRWGIPPLRRIEFRDCVNFRSEDLHLWIRSLSHSNVWAGIEEITIRRCLVKNTKVLEKFSSERKVKILD
ncbi:hypothetical protein SCHPADRAFT_947218 [Schizopora paradoxa]|uniref:F-box domain-containing protein n=1 Tax=Schizopora paradoxa TaxID=27342 RepID=A0A0H2R046_9AGAM|nr:hypothetical protein SCHPADRAFT_947218 [Schizopora paradoxa]